VRRIRDASSDMVAGARGMRFWVDGSWSVKAGKEAERRWEIRASYWLEGEKEPGTTRIVGLVVDMARRFDEVALGIRIVGLRGG
jgi:hypothetical protein